MKNLKKLTCWPSNAPRDELYLSISSNNIYVRGVSPINSIFKGNNSNSLNSFLIPHICHFTDDPFYVISPDAFHHTCRLFHIFNQFVFIYALFPLFNHPNNHHLFVSSQSTSPNESEIITPQTSQTPIHRSENCSISSITTSNMRLIIRMQFGRGQPRYFIFVSAICVSTTEVGWRSNAIVCASDIREERSQNSSAARILSLISTTKDVSIKCTGES